MIPPFSNSHVRWERAFRVIPSKFPPIDLFEDLTNDPAEWELLAQIETAVNPAYRDAIGEVSFVPVDHRVSGPDATWVMAPFCHLNPLGSRFSDGTYGVYYAGNRMETAIYETIYHLEIRLRAGQAASDDLDQRVLVGVIEGDFVDLNSDANAAAPFLDPNSNTASQAVGATARRAGEDGILYESVRDPGHLALAVFIPPRVSPPKQERHLQYHWTGQRIDKYFDYLLQGWIDVP